MTHLLLPSYPPWCVPTGHGYRTFELMPVTFLEKNKGDIESTHQLPWICVYPPLLSDNLRGTGWDIITGPGTSDDCPFPAFNPLLLSSFSSLHPLWRRFCPTSLHDAGNFRSIFFSLLTRCPSSFPVHSTFRRNNDLRGTHHRFSGLVPLFLIFNSRIPTPSFL